MHTFGPVTAELEVKLSIVSREWTQATPWVFLWALPIPFMLVNPQMGSLLGCGSRVPMFLQMGRDMDSIM